MAATVDGRALMPAPFRVLARTAETADTWTLALAGDDRRFAPGQFAMLYAFGAGEAPISVSALDGGLVHTIRAVGAVTQALCDTPVGGVIGVRGPYGTAWPLAEAAGRDVVIVAGGIGLAPLRPVVHALLAERDRYGAVSVVYGSRSPSDLLYVDELERWSAAADVAVTVDRPEPGWTGRVGVVTQVIARAPFDPANALAMVCGPEVMMRFAAAALRSRGVAGEAIWVSLERSMKCGAGHCGHCQLGPVMICRDGAVFRHDVVEPLLGVAEL
jgi:NAD(P)H-flavin reductase